MAENGSAHSGEELETWGRAVFILHPGSVID